MAVRRPRAAARRRSPGEPWRGPWPLRAEPRGSRTPTRALGGARHGGGTGGARRGARGTTRATRGAGGPVRPRRAAIRRCAPGEAPASGPAREARRRRGPGPRSSGGTSARCRRPPARVAGTPVRVPRSGQPLSAAVVRVRGVAVDTAVQRHEAGLDGAKRGSKPVVRGDEGVRRRDPQQAAVDRLVAVPLRPAARSAGHVRRRPVMARSAPRRRQVSAPALDESSAAPPAGRRGWPPACWCGGVRMLLPGVVRGRRPERREVARCQAGGLPVADRPLPPDRTWCSSDHSQMPGPSSWKVGQSSGPSTVGVVAAVEVVVRWRARPASTAAIDRSMPAAAAG